MRPIYFDNNATTPVEQEVLDRMIPYFTQEYGNPSNTTHVFGWTADEAVKLAREQVASLIHADPSGVVFMSGATEAINHVVKGVAHGKTSGHILTVATEHKAVLMACESLESSGIETTYLPVDSAGLVSVDDVRAGLRDDTLLVIVMWANNETGVLQPVGEIAELLKDHPALFFTDATQSLGKVEVNVEHVDYLACSAHKFYGPKGVGALYIRTGLELPNLLHGGGQERGRRATTLNVPGIVGMGAAAEIAEKRLPADEPAMAERRDRFERDLQIAYPDVVVNGVDAPRLPQTSNVSFPGVLARDMMAEIGRIAVSTGSACASGSGKPSHVLSAMGITPESAQGTVRFSMSRHTTDEEIAEANQLLQAHADKKHVVA